MTIRKGAPWGNEVPRPSDLVAVADDAALAELVRSCRGDAVPMTVRGGDLCRTVGVRPAAAARDRMRRVPIDLLRVRLDGVDEVAVANVVARRRWWRGRIVVVANAQYLGRWDVAPGSHPNDGRADVLEVDPAMTLRQRWHARQRLPSGTHLPHPCLRTSRTTDATWRFDPALDVYVDGRRHRRVHELRVTVEADAFELHL